MYNNFKTQKGFTLIEIAIVLVIIGLLLGGMLKGQELITNTRVKRIINDFNSISAAVLSYQDRYNATPGDDANAASRFAAPANINGGGNGTLAGNWDDAAGTTSESRLFWLHLRASGLIAGSTTGGVTGAGGNQPGNAYGGIIGADDDNMGLTGIVVCQGNIPEDIAALVDNQIDDGVSNTGRLLAATGATSNAAAATAGLYTAGNTAVTTICKVM